MSGDPDAPSYGDILEGAVPDSEAVLETGSKKKQKRSKSEFAGESTMTTFDEVETLKERLKREASYSQGLQGQLDELTRQLGQQSADMLSLKTSSSMSLQAAADRQSLLSPALPILLDIKSGIKEWIKGLQKLNVDIPIARRNSSIGADPRLEIENQLDYENLKRKDLGQPALPYLETITNVQLLQFLTDLYLKEEKSQQSIEDELLEFSRNFSHRVVKAAKRANPTDHKSWGEALTEHVWGPWARLEEMRAFLRRNTAVEQELIDNILYSLTSSGRPFSQKGYCNLDRLYSWVKLKNPTTLEEVKSATKSFFADMCSKLYEVAVLTNTLAPAGSFQPRTDHREPPPPINKGRKRDRSEDRPKAAGSRSAKAPGKDTTSVVEAECNHCGARHQGANSKCSWKDTKNEATRKFWNPDASVAWARSEQGKAAHARWPSEEKLTMGLIYRLLNTDAESKSNSSTSPRGSNPKGKSGHKGQGKPNKGKPHMRHHIVGSLETSDILPYQPLISTRIFSPIQGERIAGPRVGVLVDTGALDSSYISNTVVDKLCKMYGFNFNVNTDNQSNVKSPLFDIVSRTQGTIDIDIEIYNEVTNTREKIRLNDAKIVESEFDVIIGKPDIKRHALLQKLHNQILDDLRVVMTEDGNCKASEFKRRENHAIDILETQRVASATSVGKVCTPVGVPHYTIADCTNENDQRYTPDMRFDNVRVQSEGSSNSGRVFPVKDLTELHDAAPSTSHADMPTCILTALSKKGLADPRIQSALSVKQQKDITEGFSIKPFPEAILKGRISKGDLLQGEDDGNTQDDDLINRDIEYADPDKPCMQYMQIPVGENTTWHFQKKVKSLMSEYSAQLSSALPTEPARVTPMSLEIDEDRWKQRANRAPARVQSILKDKDLRSKVSTLSGNGILENAPDATEWSQALLAPKGEEYRFCVDYRNLNDASKANGFPLPRIKEIIQRVGYKKPLLFAVLDLTSGYHQMPLSKASRKYTAFRTTTGIYQWTRVPMGLKNAAG